MRTQWTSRTVIDAVGEAGGVELNEDDEAWLMDVLTDKEITYEDSEIALARYGLGVEFNI